MQPGIRLIDWLVLEGTVIDKGKAEASDSCKCLDGACFHQGIVGALTEDMVKRFCKTEEPFDPAVAERVRMFMAAKDVCTDELVAKALIEEEVIGERPLASIEESLVELGEVLKCMCREASKGGLEVC